MSEPIKWNALGNAWFGDICVHAYQYDDAGEWDVSYRGDVSVEIFDAPDRNTAARAVVAAVRVLRGETDDSTPREG